MDEEKNDEHLNNHNNNGGGNYGYVQELEPEPIEEEPQYKIINHLTFEYCEI